MFEFSDVSMAQFQFLSCQVFAGPSPSDFDHYSFDYHKVSHQLVMTRKSLEDALPAVIE